MIPLPIAFLAQESGQTTQVERAKMGGYKSVALQIRGATNASVKAFRDAGLFVAEWDTVDAFTKLHDGVQAFIPQIEGPGQFQGVKDAIAAGVGKGLPQIVVTTYAGLDTQDGAQRLKAATGIDTLFVECYRDDNHWNVDWMLRQGTVYGFAAEKLYPLVGTYRGEHPWDYVGLIERSPSFGIYIIEQMSDAQLELFRGILPVEAAPAPNPADVNAQINKLAHTWLDAQLPDARPLSRLRSIARIATTTDAQWTAARAAIKQALDNAGA